MSVRLAGSGLCVLAAVLVCLAAGGTACAQAGSTGGSLGKSGKSVTGGGGAPAEKPAVRSAPSTGGYSLNGTWHVRQKCNTGDFEILLSLKHSSPTSFSGSGQGLTTGSVSTVVDGQLSGRSVSFRRPGGLTGDSWTGTLSGNGRSFSGSTKGALWQCTYSASKR